MVEAVLIIAGAYLVGSVPTGYLVSRYAAGIDIRDYGSGNVGAANIMAHVGRWTGLAQGIFDCLVKGAGPVLLGRLLGLDLWIAGAAGFAAVAGHNWSPFLRLTGGRGVATAIGAALGLLMWREILILGVAVLIMGRILTRETGLWTFISLLALPATGYAFGQPLESVLTTVCTGLLIMSKRLTANWEPPPAGHALGRVLVYRLIWDRDVPGRVEWTDRRPG